MGSYLSTKWITTVIHIQISKSNVGTPGAIEYTKANRNIVGIIKYTPWNMRNILVTHVERNALKKNLDKHMAIHLETLRFECDVCGKKYQWQSSLAKHMGSKHAPTPPPASEHHERSPSPEF